MPYVRRMCATASCKASCKAFMCATASCNASTRHVHLGQYILFRLKVRTTHIGSFGYGFACATTMGYTGFRLSFGIIIIDYYQIKTKKERSLILALGSLLTPCLLVFGGQNSVILLIESFLHILFARKPKVLHPCPLVCCTNCQSPHRDSLPGA